MSGIIILQTIIFITAAIICVPLAKRFGLSAVLGYLIAGILVGPYVLEFVGEEGEDILHFAEFGVVIMLFLIGLEIEPSHFWKMRKSILGKGGLQLGLTLPIAYLLLILAGFNWESSVVVGMSIVLSSTAIVLQILKEKDLMNTSYGNAAFSTLLFQDILVIPMLAIIPLLGNAQTIENAHGANDPYLLESLPLAVQTLVIILSVVLIILAGKFLVAPVLRWVARTRLRELVIGSAFLIVLSLDLLMETVGLSPALGAFLGGVVLANSEFKHELESNLEPFKGLLLGLFFMAIGASINFVVIVEQPTMIAVLVIGVILLKAVMLYVVASIFRMKMDQKLLYTIGLAQMGEFAFVLFSFAFQLQVISQEVMDVWLVVTALTMALAPILAIINERFILPKVGTREKEPEPDEITVNEKVILVGFGHFGSTVGRFLRANKVNATILDNNSETVDVLRKLGLMVYYGDATRVDLLESAGIANADYVILAINNPEHTVQLAGYIKKNYPKVKLLARARGVQDAAELLKLGIDKVFREAIHSAVYLAEELLKEMGHDPKIVERLAENFVAYDERSLRELALGEAEPDTDYYQKVKKEIELQEKLLQEDARQLSGLASEE